MPSVFNSTKAFAVPTRFYVTVYVCTDMIRNSGLNSFWLVEPKRSHYIALKDHRLLRWRWDVGIGSVDCIQSFVHELVGKVAPVEVPRDRHD